MGKPKSNGLFDVGGQESKRESNFFCIRLVQFIGEHEEFGSEAYQKLWEDSFEKAKKGDCPFLSECPTYEKSIKKHGKQLNLFQYESEQTKR